MKTEVIITRSLFGLDIKQKTKSEFFSATDLGKAGNAYRRSISRNDFNLSQYLKSKSTIEFIEELTAKYKTIPLIKGRGRNSATWVHPLLFIDIALAIDPKLKIEVYDWIFDSLIKYRNDSGSSYKDMSSALYKRFNDHKKFPKFIENVANYIKDQIGVSDWNNATEKQLSKRDRIHRSIITLSNVLTDPKKIVQLGVSEHLK